MIEFLSTSYFTSLLNLFSALGFVIVLIKTKAKIPLKNLFFVYALVSIIQALFTIIIEVYNPYNLGATYIPENLNNLFILCEILLFTLFYYLFIHNKTLRLIIVFAVTIILIWINYLWFIKGHFNEIYKQITVAQTFCFIVFSLFYFYETLKSQTLQQLDRSPIFWIATGFFVLCSFLFPLFLFLDQIVAILPHAFFGIYSVNNIAYTILFICLIKATLCQAKLAN